LSALVNFFEKYALNMIDVDYISTKEIFIWKRSVYKIMGFDGVSHSSTQPLSRGRDGILKFLLWKFFNGNFHDFFSKILVKWWILNPNSPLTTLMHLIQKLILHHSATCIDNNYFYEKYLFLNYKSQALSRNNCFCPNFSAPTKKNMKEENFLSSFFTQCFS